MACGFSLLGKPAVKNLQTLDAVLREPEGPGGTLFISTVYHVPMSVAQLHFDVVIFGGGAAGLWLLDELVRDGYDAVLLEANALGSGQTVASQGIIHGGLKYTLTGLFNPSADAIKEMPGLWRDCMAGTRLPDLTATQRRSDFCYLWSTQSLMSKAGMFAASHANTRTEAQCHVPCMRSCILILY